MKSPPRKGVFNPWYQRDRIHDATDEGPSVRRTHFREYLAQRLGKTRVLLLGEALGYRGGHFSGIPMTSERMLLGPGSERVAAGVSFRRCSKPGLVPGGFTEPTATFVWGEIHRAGLDPFEVLIWNMFPWHPFDPRKGMLSNRTPSDEELDRGLEPLGALLALVRPRMVVAVGKKAYVCASSTLGAVPLHEVRHPANGGGGKFRAQFRKLLGKPAA